MTDLTIVAFGDSITAAIEVPTQQRWPSLLEQGLTQRFPARAVRVVNVGVGGDTSREGLQRIAGVVACKPNIVLVEFGGNDTTSEPERHVPLREYVANLGIMQRTIQQEAGARMVLLTFPPIINSWIERCRPLLQPRHGGFDEHVELYRQSTRRFAVERDLPLIDIDLALRQACGAGDWGICFQPDGVHLTRGGNRVVCEAVLPSLARLVEG